MLFVKAYPTSVCYLLELKQPNKETKPSRRIPVSLSKLRYVYNIIDFQLMRERPTVAASTVMCLMQSCGEQKGSSCQLGRGFIFR